MKTRGNIVKLCLTMLVAGTFELLCAWFGELLLRVGSIVVGVVTGLLVWLWTDLQTAFICGFLAWILTWFCGFFATAFLNLSIGLALDREEPSDQHDDALDNETPVASQ